MILASVSSSFDSSIFYENPTIQVFSLIIFIFAVTHIFLARYFNNLAHKYHSKEFVSTGLHFLGEVEAIFGIWALILFLGLIVILGDYQGAKYFITKEVSYTEPSFVFVIMVVAATKPIIYSAKKVLVFLSYLIPLKKKSRFVLSALSFGPILGSFITEPAAMTLVALILKDYIFSKEISQKMKYCLLGVLFVNISIGGTLTNFAAPPVLVVAQEWNWSTLFMLNNFGWKAIVAIAMNNLLFYIVFKKEFNSIENEETKITEKENPIPLWICLGQLFFLLLVIVNGHDIPLFVGAFLFFLAWYTATKKHQDFLKLRESLLVGFFLAGLITIGRLQGWWLQDMFSYIQNPKVLFFGATFLTSITDNAALTYLGTQVPDISEAFKYFLVAGAVSGGGLTVIANAPNPAGFGILKGSFGKNGISPLLLFLGALIPTAISCICFLLL